MSASIRGRDFDPDKLNALLMSDITYLGTDRGRLFLRAVRDGCLRVRG